MLKSKGKTCMVEEPSHVKQLSLNHVCKIGLKGQVIISPSYLKYAEYEHEPGEGAAAVLILHNRSFQKYVF
jgi:hypothetical protein